MFELAGCQPQARQPSFCLTSETYQTLIFKMIPMVKMRFLKFITLLDLFLLGGCRHAQVVPAGRVPDELRLQCTGPHASKPPKQTYNCTIDVLNVAEHERWLVLPSFMENSLASHLAVVLIEGMDTPDGILYCGSRRYEVTFEAIPIAAGQRLHLTNWQLDNFGRQHDLMTWLGPTPPLSNGETLGVVFQRLRRAIPDASHQSEPGIWRAPAGTTIEFAPKGFRHFDVAPAVR